MSNAPATPTPTPPVTSSTPTATGSTPGPTGWQTAPTGTSTATATPSPTGQLPRTGGGDAYLFLIGAAVAIVLGCAILYFTVYRRRGSGGR